MSLINSKKRPLTEIPVAGALRNEDFDRNSESAKRDTLVAELKLNIKKLLRSSIASRYPSILIASMGRSGCTLIYNAVRLGMVRARRMRLLGRYGESLCSDSVWDLSDARFHSGVVYVTHGLAEELPAHAKVKVVFVFGPASAAALSVHTCRDRYGSSWVARHFEHLRASGSFSDLARRDVLGFEKQIDGWLTQDKVPLLALHYDHLWDHEQALSDFVGFSVQLPPRRQRESQQFASSEIGKEFSATYASLDNKIARLPVCNLRNA